MRGEGVEPSQPYGQQPLKLSRLPFRHPRIKLKFQFFYFTLQAGFRQREKTLFANGENLWLTDYHYSFCGSTFLNRFAKCNVIKYNRENNS